MNPNEHSADYCSLTGLLFRVLQEKIGRTLEGWEGPEIIAESGTYKLEWYEQEAEGRLTIYDDGGWVFSDEHGDQEGKIHAPHHRYWIDRQKREGKLGIVALGAVNFFKELKKKPRKR
jgi:hypothetical protein